MAAYTLVIPEEEREQYARPCCNIEPLQVMCVEFVGILQRAGAETFCGHSDVLSGIRKLTMAETIRGNSGRYYHGLLPDPRLAVTDY